MKGLVSMCISDVELHVYRLMKGLVSMCISDVE